MADNSQFAFARAIVNGGRGGKVRYGRSSSSKQEREDDLVTSAVGGRPMTAAFLPASTSHGPPPTDTPAHA